MDSLMLLGKIIAHATKQMVTEADTPNTIGSKDLVDCLFADI